MKRLASSSLQPPVDGRAPVLGHVRIDLSGDPAAFPDYLDTVVIHNRYMFDAPGAVKALVDRGMRVFGYFSPSDCWTDHATHPEGSFARLWGAWIDSVRGWASLTTTPANDRGAVPAVNYWVGGKLTALQKPAVSEGYSRTVWAFLRSRGLLDYVHGIFVDNVWTSIAFLNSLNPDGIDLDEDGLDEGDAARTAAWTAGTADCLANLRKLFPKLPLIGNGPGAEEYNDLNGPYIEDSGPREVRDQLDAVSAARVAAKDTWTSPREIWVQEQTSPQAAVAIAAIAAASGEARASIATQDAYIDPAPTDPPEWTWGKPGTADYANLSATASDVTLDYDFHRTELLSAALNIYRREKATDPFVLDQAISLT